MPPTFRFVEVSPMSNSGQWIRKPWRVVLNGWRNSMGAFKPVTRIADVVPLFARLWLAPSR